MTIKKEGGQWYMRLQVKGRRIHEPTHARTRAAALKAEAERRLELIEGEDPRLKKAPTLAEFSIPFLKFIKDAQDLDADTKRGYKDGWRRLSETPLAGMRLSSIGPADTSIIRFRLKNGQDASGSTSNQALRTLQRMLSLAVERKYIVAAPSIALREEKKRTAIITETWQEDLLLELASPMLRDFMVIMLDSGPRPEEIARMRREHILWAERAIHIPDGKSKAADRYIPLSDRMADVLRDRLSSHKSEWVFPSAVFGETDASRQAQAMAAEGAKPSQIARALGVSWPTAKRYLSAPSKVGSASVSGHISPTSVGGKMWQELMERANTEIAKRRLPPLPDGLVLYSCRHTFATRFLKASANDRAALKEIMGHSSFAVTERYVHGGIGAAAEVMNRFEADRRKVKQFGRRA